MDMIQIGIVEDQKLIVESLKALIEARSNLHLVVAVDTVEKFLQAPVTQAPDIILLDIGLPDGMSGLEGISPIKKKFPKSEVIMLTTFDDANRIFQALSAGAGAYLTKRASFDRIVEAIEVVYKGGSYMSPSIARKVVDHFAPKKAPEAVLTSRQSQIADGLVDGLSYKMIAGRLMITEETVRDHIKKMYRKLQINSKGELISMRLRGELDD